MKLALTPKVDAPRGSLATPPSINPFLKTPQEIEAVAAAAAKSTATTAEKDKAKDSGAWAGGAAYPETAKALDILAHRVAVNREVAGVHYPMDSFAGRYAALICLRVIAARYAAGNPFKKLIDDATAELVDFH